jgi:hypothetical protein
MSYHKLFETEGVAENALPSVLLEDTSLGDYYLSVVWVRDGSAVSLSSAVIALSGTYNWKQLLTTVITENDGELTIHMGTFPVGTRLDLIFNVYPHQDISASALMLVNRKSSASKKIAPSSGNYTLKKGKPWAAAITITLP